MTTDKRENVRFTLQDEDYEAVTEHEDNVRRLKEVALQDLAAQGTSQSPANSVPVSRSASRSLSNLSESGRPATTGIIRETSRADGLPHSRIHTPDASPPSTPKGDPNDPYRRSARLPQSTSIADIAPQFIFQKHTASSSSSHNSHSHLKDFFHAHHHKDSSQSAKEHTDTKHHSGFDLGRFFRHGHGRRSGHSTPVSSNSSSSVYMPEFESKVPKKVKGEDHSGYHQKYGKAGRVLGSGAGGSVRIVKRLTDNHLFAVKEFRERGVAESQKEYNKKVTAEFCVASAMHHPNVIETMEVLKENNKWYQIMEYAPFDLFAIVMTGNMQRSEIFCCFKQVLRGVEYLHSMGLAHRDLKLDNLVMDEHGVVKIIDFGSAFVFKYPFEEEIHEASGIVGSDPYLSPEVCTNVKYSPEPADIWSCAIIFCCMWLRRFPWKSPRLSDNSYKSFTLKDEQSTINCSSENLTRLPTESSSSSSAPAPGPGSNDASVSVTHPIRGPWRLYRLLPRDSRNVVKGMLELDPLQRYSMQDIINDAWIQDIDMCYEDKVARTVYKSASHHHVLVSSDVAPKAKK